MYNVQLTMKKGWKVLKS